MKDKWFYETYFDYFKTGFKYKKSLFEKKSSFQKVEILETEGFGNMLVNDGIVMTCDRDEFAYHEMLSHVPLFSHKNPKDVLIIGGGDGGTAREVLNHPVSSCVMVEIDDVVIEASKKHLKKISSELDNKRLDLRIDDGAKFVENKKDCFDVILVDSSDPVGPSSVLFGKTFYENVFKALRPGGIVASQMGSPFFLLKEQTEYLKMAKEIGFFSGFYNYCNISYGPGMWSFLFASKDEDILKNFSKKRVEESGIKFRYYNEDLHLSSFYPAQFAKEAFKPYWNLKLP